MKIHSICICICFSKKREILAV